MPVLSKPTNASAVPYRRIAAAAALLLGSTVGLQAQAALNFNAYANVYGYLNTQYSSPLLGGDVNFSVNGASAYTQNYTGSGLTTTGVASVNYTVAPAQGGTGDPVYDIITDGGRYSFSYQGQAEVKGTDLRTRMASSTLDYGIGGANPVGRAVDYTPRSSQYSYSQAQWNQGFFIGATAARPVGTYGAIVVGVTLDGDFPALADASVSANNWARLQASSSFTDTAGVDYSSSFDISTYSNDASWTGQKTVFKKLLFQYGTVFNIDLYQYVGSGNNGSAEFFSTGKITQIEIPFEATLQSGAQEAGLGDLGSLYGSVVQSATADAQNTNWDFGNNGGGFTPQVPEPQTWAMLLAGLLAVGQAARRRPVR